MAKKKEMQYEEFKYELKELKERGVELWLEGEPSTPKKIAKAAMVAETGTYIAEYVEDKEEGVKRLDFDYIENK